MASSDFNGVWSDAQLEAFLDENLPAEEMAALEAAIRENVALRERLCAIIQRRDAGIHSLSAIWRRNRLSCPSREELSAFVQGTAPEPIRGYIQFHLNVVGCRYCQANAEDLGQELRQPKESAERRRRLHQRAVDYLKRYE